MAAVGWKSRLGRLSPYLEDLNTKEIFVDTDGRVFVRSNLGNRALDEPISAAELSALAKGISRLIDASLGADVAEISGVVDDFEIRMLGPPAVPAGTVIMLRRRTPARTTLEGLRSIDVLTESMRVLLRKSLSSHSSIVIVGGRGTGRSALLGALALEAASDRRVALIGVDTEPVDGKARQLFSVSKDEGLLAAHRIGAELIVADDPPKICGRTCCSVPVLSSLRSRRPTIWTGMRRLQAALVYGRPGLSPAGAELMIESAIGVFVETGQRTGELNPQVLVFAEPRRFRDQLSLRVVAKRRSDGAEEISLDGSYLADRFGSVGGRLSAPPTRSYLDQESEPEVSESSPDALAAVQGRGGYGEVSPDFDVPERRPSAPVGRVKAREMSNLRPEQLVSQSFLVDVSDVDDPAIGTKLKEWAGESSGEPERTTSQIEQELRASDLRSTSARARVDFVEPGRMRPTCARRWTWRPSRDLDETRPPSPRAVTGMSEPRRAPAADFRVETSVDRTLREPPRRNPSEAPAEDFDDEVASFEDLDETIGEDEADGDFEDGTPILFVNPRGPPRSPRAAAPAARARGSDDRQRARRPDASSSRGMASSNDPSPATFETPATSAPLGGRSRPEPGSEALASWTGADDG